MLRLLFFIPRLIFSAAIALVMTPFMIAMLLWTVFTGGRGGKK